MSRKIITKNAYISRKTLISSVSKREKLIERRQRNGLKDLPLKRTFSIRS